MLVRTLVGRYAGDVRDFPSHIAKQMLATGRAEAPDAKPNKPEPEPAVAPVVQVVESAVQPVRRKRGRPRKKR